MPFIHPALRFVIESYPYMSGGITATVFLWKHRAIWTFVKRLFRRNRKKRFFHFDFHVRYRSRDQ